MFTAICLHCYTLFYTDLNSGQELAWSRTPHDVESFAIGTKVLCRYRDNKSWLEGRITDITRGGGSESFNVTFDGGFEELYVPTGRIKHIEGSAGYVPVDMWKITEVQIASRPSPGSVSAVSRVSLASDAGFQHFLVDPDNPTETDVIFTPESDLATFGGVLSLEEAFRLGTLMTGRRIRIPLVLKFFSERPTLLSHRPLQRLLSSVLFEPAEFMSKCHNRLKLASDEGEHLSDVFASLGSLQYIPVPTVQANQYLGAENGLLLLELMSSPAPVLQPIIDILSNVHHRARDLESDQDSENFAMLVWIVVVVSRLEGFIECAVSQLLLLERTVSNIDIVDKLIEYIAVMRRKVLGLEYFFMKALKCAEASGDVAGMVAIHAYLVLLRAHGSNEEMSGDILIRKDTPVDAESKG